MNHSSGEWVTVHHDDDADNTQKPPPGVLSEMEKRTSYLMHLIIICLFIKNPFFSSADAVQDPLDKQTRLERARALASSRVSTGMKIRLGR